MLQACDGIVLALHQRCSGQASLSSWAASSRPAQRRARRYQPAHQLTLRECVKNKVFSNCWKVDHETGSFLKGKGARASQSQAHTRKIDFCGGKNRRGRSRQCRASWAAGWSESEQGCCCTNQRERPSSRSLFPLSGGERPSFRPGCLSNTSSPCGRPFHTGSCSLCDVSNHQNTPVAADASAKHDFWTTAGFTHTNNAATYQHVRLGRTITTALCAQSL